MNLKIKSCCTAFGVALSLIMGCQEKMADGVTIERKSDAVLSPSTRPHPTAALLKRINNDYDIYGIVHFSINTYTDREWGFGNEKPEWFNPSEFDADQIVKACKDGGLQGLVVVAKHHDGFCLWPTKTTEHNITKSPFREGKGDYLREMERACRKYGLKLGVYVSPWDRNNKVYASEEYKKIFWKQVLEIFSGDYGELNELWFDGANGGDGYYGGACESRKIPKNYYDFSGLIKEVQKYQKDFCTFYDWDEGELHYPANEAGMLDPDARMTFPARADKPTPGWENCLNKGDINGSLFKQAECDFPLRPGWFYHESENGFTKSPQYLMKIYLSSIGNGGTMNIGIAPDQRGLVTDEDINALKGFANIKSRFFEKEVKSTKEPFNMVVMREDVSKGEHIDGWTLSLDGKEIQKGISIGGKRIRVFDKPLTGEKLTFTITAGSAKPSDVKIKLYYVDEELLKSVMSAKPPPRPKYDPNAKGLELKKTEKEIVYQFNFPRFFTSVMITPDTTKLGGTPVTFKLDYSDDGVKWIEDENEYRLGNVAANPIPQTIKLAAPQKAKYVRIKSMRSLKEKDPIAVLSFQLVK